MTTQLFKPHATWRLPPRTSRTRRPDATRESTAPGNGKGLESERDISITVTSSRTLAAGSLVGFDQSKTERPLLVYQERHSS